MLAVTMELIVNKVRGLFKSWTAWFNALCGFIAFGLPELAAALPLVREHLPDGLYGSVFIVTLVGNILLRFKTSRALEDK